MDSAAKLSKSFEKVIIEILLLYMVVPGKINFTQLGRYGKHGEQCWKSRACLTPEGKAMLTPENFFILTPLKS